MHLLITAGGTREYIDPVRFITNASTGKMGYAIANAALAHGHKVTLITATVNLTPPPKAEIINVITSEDMFNAVKKYFPTCDCLVMAAAVSDYTPEKTFAEKLKKQTNTFTLNLKPTADILKWAAENKTSQFLAGFALEDKDILSNAEKKMQEKNLDMIIANDPAAIGADESSLYIKLTGSQWRQTEKISKQASAEEIISIIEKAKS